MIPAADGTSEVEVSGTTVQENDDDGQEVSGSTVREVSGTTVREVSGTTVPTNPLREPLERTPVENTPPTPRRAGGVDAAHRGEEFSEEREPVGEVVAFPSRQRPVASDDDGVDLPKRPDRKTRRPIVGPLGPGCETLHDEAELFWNAYPVQKGWGIVRDRWRSARREASFETIMDGLEAYLHRTDNPHDRGFRPDPARWLREMGWIKPKRNERRGVETTSERMDRLGMTGPDGCEPVNGRRKAPEISFEDLQGSGQ
jgi:hypothetical protein